MTTYAKRVKQSGWAGFGSLYLMTPEGKFDHTLKSDCDPDNRGMLTKLYELSHVDFDGAKRIEETIQQSGGTYYYRQTVFPALHGFYFSETYGSMSSGWAEFGVHFTNVNPLARQHTPAQA